MDTHAGAKKILFDFKAATSTADWQIVNDEVMGGLSTSSFELAKGAGVFQGQLSLENDGGFASVRSLPMSHDLTGCEGFLIRVRGDGRGYKFTARTDPSFNSAMYQCGFTTRKGKWEERWLEFKDFVATFRGQLLPGEPTLAPGKVTSVGFLIADKREGPFRLEVAWIKATALAKS